MFLAIRRSKRSRQEILKDMKEVHQQFRCLEKIERSGQKQSSGCSMERSVDSMLPTCTCSARHGKKKPLSKQDIADHKARLRRRHQKLQKEYAKSLKSPQAKEQRAATTAVSA